MKTIKVNLKNRSYKIIIGRNVTGALGKHIKKLGLGSDAYIITNALVKKKYGRKLEKSLKDAGFGIRFKLVADTEKSKSIVCLTEVIEGIARFDKKKKIFIIAFGGGVIGDLAGFVSSVYKRGTSYIQLPTTLLAQVDSGIGGKTAVDLSYGKNLVGAFYQPKAVFSDLMFLESLDSRQLKNGLAEVIKYGIIQDPQLFRYLEKNYRDILDCKAGALLNIVSRSSAIKARVVSQDEREEKGIRISLNFGHTLGHAIEAAGNFKQYSHGEAIALGMLVACEISKGLGLAKDDACIRIEKLIKSVGLPVRIKGLRLNDIIKAHYRDKKFIGAKNRLVLLKDIGKIKIAENIPLAVIKKALKQRV